MTLDKPKAPSTTSANTAAMSPSARAEQVKVTSQQQQGEAAAAAAKAAKGGGPPPASPPPGTPKKLSDRWGELSNAEKLKVGAGAYIGGKVVFGEGL